MPSLVVTRRAPALSWAVVTVCLLLAGCGSRVAPGQMQGLADAGVVLASPTTADADLPSSVDLANAPGSTASGSPAAGSIAAGSAGAGSASGAGGPIEADGARSVRRGSCAGLAEQTGVTDSTITIANASDISGPVPGLFEATQDAVRAYAAYFNAHDSICGRRLAVLDLDTRTDANGDQQAYETACAGAFAAVGSQAAFDSGGADAAQRCGLPDLRGTTVTTARYECATCFAAQSSNPRQFPTSVPDFLLRRDRSAATHAAYLWIEAGPAVENASGEIRAWTRAGFHFVYTAGIDVAEFNYAPYVTRLREFGARLVRILASADQAAKLAQAMDQQDYHPDVFLNDATAYSNQYADLAGDAGDHTTVFVNFRPFEDAGSNEEMQTYLAWLQQVKPGAEPTYDGLFAWSAARLFTETAQRLGGRLTRSAMVAALRRVDGWTDHGMHAPQHVGSKDVSDCWRFLELDRGVFGSLGGERYRCGELTTVD